MRIITEVYFAQYIYEPCNRASMQVILFSFGYKYGPPDADAVWDIRFLPNPYYVPALKDKTGLEPDVAAYVLRNATAENFLSFFEPFLFSFLQSHAESGREAIRLAVGCTGGKHRSVAVVEYCKGVMSGHAIVPQIFHRDMERE
jgi:RNase adapter protein RapZ